MIVLGDFNFSPNVSIDDTSDNTLRTGDIVDEARFGADVHGDWDETDMTDVNPVDPNTGSEITCCDGPRFRGVQTRFDRFYYTDSLLEIGRNIILNTQTMTEEQRVETGLKEKDTSEPLTSYHMPLVVDIRLR